MKPDVVNILTFFGKLISLVDLTEDNNFLNFILFSRTKLLF